MIKNMRTLLWFHLEVLPDGTGFGNSVVSDIWVDGHFRGNGQLSYSDTS